jgi:hypothetical protein
MGRRPHRRLRGRHGRGPLNGGATISEVEGSHVIMISQPQAAADVILEAVAAADRERAGVT